MKDNHLRNFIIIGIVLLLISFAYPFILRIFFQDWQDSGTFGDSYGALNALFSGLAFAGLIITILIQRTELKNQSKELELQRTEMALQRSEMIETRNEFLLNRTTSIMFQQLERFEASISDLSIRRYGTTYKGNSAIFFLDDNRVKFTKGTDLTDEEHEQAEKKNIAEESKMLIDNKEEVEKFAINIYKATESLKSIIYISDLNVHELNSIKNIFFENIGFIAMGVIESISDLAKRQLDLFETEDYSFYGIGVGELLRANIFLKPVKEFYNTHITEENFEELKDEFVERKGAMFQ